MVSDGGNMITLNDRSKPMYFQIYMQLKEQIQSGCYKPGDQIPTEIQLSELYQVSRITVRRTIEELCVQGVLVKRQGKGTFVEAPRIYRKIENDNNMSFSAACIANGRRPLISFPARSWMRRTGRRNF